MWRGAPTPRHFLMKKIFISETGLPLALKAKNAAAKLDIHPRTLARWEKAGLIRSLKLARHRLYAVKDLEALVEKARDWNQGVTNG
jgi:hypothetical protein